VTQQDNNNTQTFIGTNFGWGSWHVPGQITTPLFLWGLQLALPLVLKHAAVDRNFINKF